jgi:hypothetical protein
VVERDLAKVDVEGSNPFSRSKDRPSWAVFLCLDFGDPYANM